MAVLNKSKRSFSAYLWVMSFVLFAVGVVALTRVYEFEKPQVAFLNEISLLGSTVDISLAVSDEKSGIQALEVSLVQDKKIAIIHTRQFVRQGYLTRSGSGKMTETFPLDTGSLGFEDGRANIVVTVRDFSFWNWLRGNETISSYPVVLDNKIPKLWLIDSPNSMKPGSAGVVVFRASEPIKNYGVEINGFLHQGFPIPARGEDVYGAMIGIPYDAESLDKAQIMAYDRAGNRGTISFGFTLRKGSKNLDRINVSDAFLNRKMPEFTQYYPDMLNFDSQLEQYIYVNNTVRSMNAVQIADVCQKSTPEILWDGPFKRMRRSSRRSGFADYRAYYYKEKKIDSQVHLGIDLASVRNADVEAANGGIVRYAAYLGIYGEMVILDHGTGVFSLYSHMSQIQVKVGDQVAKGALLGKTGTTGMAGGDHLHFSMLVNGIFVNPLEWWDRSWLELNISKYLKG